MPKDTEFDLLRVRLAPGSIEQLKRCAQMETEETGCNTTMSDIVRGQISDYLRSKGIVLRRQRKSAAALGQGVQPRFIPSGHDIPPVNALFQVARFDMELGAAFTASSDFPDMDDDDDTEE